MANQSMLHKAITPGEGGWPIRGACFIRQENLVRKIANRSIFHKFSDGGDSITHFNGVCNYHVI